MSTSELFHLSFLPHGQKKEEVYREKYYDDVHSKYMLPKKRLFAYLGYNKWSNSNGNISETWSETNPIVYISNSLSQSYAVSINHILKNLCNTQQCLTHLFVLIVAIF